MAGTENCEAKKRKYEEDTENEAVSVLKKFQLVKVLKEDTAKKFVVVEGLIPSELEKGDKDEKNKAVLLLEKKPLVVDGIEDLVSSGSAKLTFVNDCYSNYQLASAKPLHGKIKMQHFYGYSTFSILVAYRILIKFGELNASFFFTSTG